MNRRMASEEARLLINRMTTAEKIAQLEYDAPAIERLNIPEYNYWNEALHGVARAGVATMFPQAIGMAAMFDPELLEEVGDAIATEGRAKYNEFQRQDDRDIYKGLTFWSPNINIFRDPRWGRGHETYGEDPFLTSKLGVSFINGLQGKGPYLKLAACAKHFAVHSGPEALRHEFNVDVSKKDLSETYLPAFKAAVQEGNVESVMSAYNSVNQVPAPCNTRLLDILREDWGFEGHITSDYGANEDIYQHHHYAETAAEAMALAVNAGTDLCAGHITESLNEALERGLIEEKTIDLALNRLLTTRFLLGMFSKDNDYDQIPFEAIDSKEHQELALKTAEKSVVLLKNEDYLPLEVSTLKNVAVIGPNANSRIALEGNYAGTASRYTTVVEGIQDYLREKARVYYAQGCHLYKDREGGLAKASNRISEAVSVAQRSDVVFLCLGLDADIEGEQGDAGNEFSAGDKRDLRLPGEQQELLNRLLKLDKPIVLILLSGSALTLDSQEKNKNLKAILQAWYPGSQGGQAISNVLFGKVSPSGKLPVTFYQSTEALPAFEEYRMKNRTYRYLEKSPLYPFGYGLTYHHAFEIQSAQIKREIDVLNLDVEVHNPNAKTAEDILQVYIKGQDAIDEVLNPRLCAFERISILGEQSAHFQLKIPANALNVVNEAGEFVQESHCFDFYIGFSQPDERSVELTGKAPMNIVYQTTGKKD